MAAAIQSTARTLQAAASQSSSGAGASLDLGAESTDDTLVIDLGVSAITGSTPTLNVSVETSTDGALWRVAGSFTSQTATGLERIGVSPVDRYVRVAWTLSAGASATFAVTGTSYRPLANLGDLDRFGPKNALGDATPLERISALVASSREAANILSDARYVFPLTEWDESLRKDVCHIAVWDLLSSRIGFNPETDASVRMNQQDATKRLQRGSYVGIVDSTPDDDEGEAYVGEAYVSSGSSRPRW